MQGLFFGCVGDGCVAAMETEQSMVGQGAAVYSLPAAGAASTSRPPTAAGRLGKRGRGRHRLVMKRNGLQADYVNIPSWTWAATLSHCQGQAS
jgi:hypothetical protein